MTKIEITSCLHAAIMVTNVERSHEFYGGLLGLNRIDRALKYPGAWYQIGDFQVHLIEDKNYRTQIDLEASTRNPHIALGVRDVNAIAQHLRAANCVVKMSNSGRAALFTQDPDGNAIELTQVDI